MPFLLQEIVTLCVKSFEELALAEIGVEHNKNRAEVKHNIIFSFYINFSPYLIFVLVK